MAGKKDYYYELRCVDGDTEITHKFNADLDSEKLIKRLEFFLAGCSWHEETIKNILNI